MEINWILLFVIAVMALCLYHGYRVGLVRMGYLVVTFLASIVLVRLLAPVGAQLLKHNESFYQAIRNPIEQMLDEKFDQNQNLTVHEIAETYNMRDGDFLKMLEDMADNTGVVDMASQKAKGIMADYLTLWVIDLIVYVALFLVIHIGFRILGVILDYLAKLPGIRGANKRAGCLVGAVEGIAFVWIGFLVITVFSSTAWGNWCFGQIARNPVLAFLYVNNVFLIFVP